jgi:hypothetical protein
MWHVYETGEVHISFGWENLMERDHLGDLCVGGKIILKWIIKKLHGEAWIGLIWLSIWIDGGLL